MQEDDAIVITVRALAHIAADERSLRALQAQTGLDAAGIREVAGNPELLGGILDFLLADEALLLSFCENAGIPPETPARARLALPGAPPELHDYIAGAAHRMRKR